MSPPNSPLLSVCLIVKNEAERLPACLQSVQSLQPEIVVVDTGSTDNTSAVAKQLGAHVVFEKWTGDFSRARNVGLALARGRWILVLDADESIPAKSVEALRQVLASTPDAAYALQQRSPVVGGADMVASTVRLWPNLDAIRYQNSVHEEVVSSLERVGIPIRTTDIVIDHTGYGTKEIVEAKKARNAALLNVAVRDEPALDPQVIFNHALSELDASRFDAAVDAFERCIAVAGPKRPNLQAAARLKKAEALVRANRFDEAIVLLPTEPDLHAHPLALALRAFIEERRGNLHEARRWHEATLAPADTAYMPPTAVGVLKFKSLMFLGDFWARAGREDVGAGVLRLALQLNQRALPDLGAGVLERYAALVETPPPR